MSDYITPEDRALIDEAIAAGKVQKIAYGETGFPGYKFDEKQNQLRIIDFDKTMAKRAPSTNAGLKRMNHFREEAARAREEHAHKLIANGHTMPQVAAMIGCNERSLRKILERSRARTATA